MNETIKNWAYDMITARVMNAEKRLYHAQNWTPPINLPRDISFVNTRKIKENHINSAWKQKAMYEYILKLIKNDRTGKK